MVNNSSFDIGQKYEVKEKELQECIINHSVLEAEILKLRREIINLQGKVKDLEVKKVMSNQNMRVCSSELRMLKHQYFSAQRSGL